MKARARKRVPPWIVMYVGMVAAVILAERDRVAELADTSPVAPVIVVQPALELDAIALRSDL